LSIEYQLLLANRTLLLIEQNNNMLNKKTINYDFNKTFLKNVIYH